MVGLISRAPSAEYSTKRRRLCAAARDEWAPGLRTGDGQPVFSVAARNPQAASGSAAFLAFEPDYSRDTPSREIGTDKSASRLRFGPHVTCLQNAHPVEVPHSRLWSDGRRLGSNDGAPGLWWRLTGSRVTACRSPHTALREGIRDGHRIAVELPSRRESGKQLLS